MGHQVMDLENAMNTRPLVNPVNVLFFLEAWLKLPVEAFRPPFRGIRHRYQTELLQSYKHYQLALKIRLPSGHAALQLQQQRRLSLMRKLNSWTSLLTEAGLARLSDQAERLAAEQRFYRLNEALNSKTRAAFRN